MGAKIRVRSDATSRKEPPVFRSTTTFACLLIALAGTTASFAAPDDSSLPAGWYARIVTSRGTVLARLLPEQAPQSVAHFAGLAQGTLEWIDHATGETEKLRYYDGIPVQRVDAGQLFEIGDASAAGRATPDLWVPREGMGPVGFDRAGRLGMARDGGRMSGVTFFVTASAVPWFVGKFPCFGEVVSDLATVRKITQVRATPDGHPLDPLTVDTIEVFSVGEVEPLPTPELHFPEAPKPRLRLDAIR
jgi:peptidyl-prolyl cis-trans isomerase A (cyclophilin A)